MPGYEVEVVEGVDGETEKDAVGDFRGIVGEAGVVVFEEGEDD